MCLVQQPKFNLNLQVPDLSPAVFRNKLFTDETYFDDLMGQIGPTNGFSHAPSSPLLLRAIEELEDGMRGVFPIPDYLAAFCRAHCFLMKGDGPLPIHERYYIAILAVARHRCHWLLNMLKEEFLKQHGDRLWLCGYKHTPAKLRMLNDLNKYLAHRPWLIDRAHIKKLFVGADHHKWSVGELVQAICILTHFHGFCSIVYGHGTSIVSRQDPLPTPTLSDAADVISGSPSRRPRNISFRMPLAEMIDESVKANVKIFVQVEAAQEQISPVNLSEPMAAAELEDFLEDQSFAYEDYARKGKENATHLSPSDYNWDTQGYCVINRLYNDVGHILDDKFRIALSSAFCSEDGVSEDSTAYRTVVWNYVQKVFRISRDDYDYSEVDRLLQKEMKEWIKSTSCYPERAKEGTGPSQDERPHMLMLVTEARIQCALLYALRALSAYFMHQER